MKRTSSCEHHDQKEEARALKRRHDDWQPPAVLKVALAASAPPSSEAAAVATTISGGTKSNGPTTAGHAASDTEGLARRNQELVCRNQELQQEVEDANRMFQDLSVINCALRTELHEVKQALLNAGTRKDEDLEDVLPVRWFCEASEDEVEQALKEGGRVKYKAQFDKAAKEVDEALRNAGLDPFIRREGRIIGVDEEHPVLQELTERWGAPVANLVAEKKQEIEVYCPSGHYPTAVLFVDGKELRMGEAVERLVDALVEARVRPRRKNARRRLRCTCEKGTRCTRTAGRTSKSTSRTALQSWGRKTNSHLGRPPNRWRWRHRGARPLWRQWRHEGAPSLWRRRQRQGTRSLSTAAAAEAEATAAVA